MFHQESQELGLLILLLFDQVYDILGHFILILNDEARGKINMRMGSSRFSTRDTVHLKFTSEPHIISSLLSSSTCVLEPRTGHMYRK